jgi:hypothetical protein
MIGRSGISQNVNLRRRFPAENRHFPTGRAEPPDRRVWVKEFIDHSSAMPIADFGSEVMS